MQSQPPIVTFRGKRLYLRPVLRSDIAQITIWINDPDVKRFLSNPYPVSEIIEERWFERISTSREEFVFGVVIIHPEKDDELIGVMGIHQINEYDRTATTGAYIGNKAYWGNGYGTEAKMLLLKYAFHSLNLRRMESAVIAYNGRSHAYMKKCGYVVEGVRKRRHFKDGRYFDEVLYRLFRNEWEPVWRAYRSKFLA